MYESPSDFLFKPNGRNVFATVQKNNQINVRLCFVIFFELLSDQSLIDVVILGVNLVIMYVFHFELRIATYFIVYFLQNRWIYALTHYLSFAGKVGTRLGRDN